MNKLLRPKTRGELLNALQRGVKCEVKTSTVEITSIMLKKWSGFDKFKTSPSEYYGWTIFEPDFSNQTK